MWFCPKCKNIFTYPFKKCNECNEGITEMKSDSLIVEGVTEVLVPSKDHQEVPYYVLIVADNEKNLFLIKSQKRYKIGEKFISKKTEKNYSIGTVGVIGSGPMGSGIASYLLALGIPVIIRTRGKGNELFEQIKSMAKKISSLDEKELSNNLKVVSELKDMSSCSLIIECVPEIMEIKKQLFKDLESVCQKKTILATNTSSLSISEISDGLSNPERVIGIHFFNPVYKMSLVEIVKGPNTNSDTINISISFVKQINKMQIVVKDAPGFVVNRLLIPYLNDAANLLENNIASIEDIDNAIKLGLNHPMGPFRLMDLIGLDVVDEILNELNTKIGGEKFVVNPIIKDMIKKGRLGMKTKKGFYDY
jgi:3-hydroxybutyryl-CoA dehydrogenase